jgi:hypothetical protein
MSQGYFTDNSVLRRVYRGAAGPRAPLMQVVHRLRCRVCLRIRPLSTSHTNASPVALLRHVRPSGVRPWACEEVDR